MASTPAEMIGTVLNGRWRLLRLIGEGGMGAVFEAEGPPGVGKRAVKLLHQEYAKEAVILARFLAEGQAGRAINHPNVAQVLETAKAENGVPYLVMELLHGTSVASYVDAGQAIPLAQAVHIAHGVLQALGVAHGLGIVHRDIKPDNLFLVNDGAGSFNVKVLDFGIAKVMDVAGGMGQKTRTGVLLGTPGYMSPEQIKDSRGVDARADLWSVGIILYELLTGASPFPADNEFSRLTSVLTEDVKPIGDVVPQLAAWNGFFQRALAKEPARRFQSADEMDAALFSTLRGRSIRPPATLALESESQASYRPVDPAAVSKNPLQTTAMQAFNGTPPPKPAEAVSTLAALGVTKPADYRAFPAPSRVPVREMGPTKTQSSDVAQVSPVSPAPQISHVSPAPQISHVSPAPMYPVRVEAPQAGAAGAPRARAPSEASGLIPAPSLQTIPASARGSVPPPTFTPGLGGLGGGVNVTAPINVETAQLAQIAPTHVSAINNAATAAAEHVPSIDVIDAPRRGAPYWVVAVVALCTFGAGLALGLVLR